MTNDTPPIHRTGEAAGFLPARGSQGKPITVIATETIPQTFDALDIRGKIK